MSTKNKINASKQKVSFSALDPFIQDNIPNGEEKVIVGIKWIEWGTRNKYPNFLHDLFEHTPTLRSIINGLVDYVVGNSVHSNTVIMDDEEAEDIVKAMAMSIGVYGGFALNVLRNKVGGVAKIIPLDMRNIRSDKKGDILYYSEDYKSKSYGRGKYIEYPKFDKDAIDVMSSIFYYKNDRYATYPTPIYCASVNDCLAEKCISEFQLNEINNGFASNVIVSLNNGVPTDEIKEEIEEAFDEKFQGYQNAGRPMIVYSQDKEHAPEITKLNDDKFIDRYTSIDKKSRQNIFTSFRANPNLFGIATESNGFNSEEYGSAFKLFNRTMVKPIQKAICNSFDKIMGEQGTITIDPFSLEDKDTDVE